MLLCSPPEYRELPTPRGFTETDTEWRCDPEVYREFIRETTGQEPPTEPEASDCYLIRTRLEGFIEQRKANDEWTETLPDRYQDVRSLEEIEALARFFREYHETLLRPDV